MYPFNNSKKEDINVTKDILLSTNVLTLLIHSYGAGVSDNVQVIVAVYFAL